MSSNIIIEKEKIQAIITEAYKQINEKEVYGQSKATSIEKIVEFMKKELNDDAD